MAGDSILVYRETAVDQDVRNKLIESLKSRGWTPLDAEQVVTRVEALYQRESGEWKVLLWEVAGGEQNVYLVAREVKGQSVFDSPLQSRARDVASALNEAEAPG